MARSQQRWAALAGAATASVVGFTASAANAAATEPEPWPVVHQKSQDAYFLDGYEVAGLPGGLSRFGVHASSASDAQGNRTSSISWVRGPGVVYGKVSSVRSESITDLDRLRETHYAHLDPESLERVNVQGRDAYHSAESGDVFWVEEPGSAVTVFLLPERWDSADLLAFAESVTAEDARPADEAEAQEEHDAEEEEQEKVEEDGAEGDAEAHDDTQATEDAEDAEDAQEEDDTEHEEQAEDAEDQDDHTHSDEDTHHEEDHTQATEDAEDAEDAEQDAHAEDQGGTAAEDSVDLGDGFEDLPEVPGDTDDAAEGVEDGLDEQEDAPGDGDDGEAEALGDLVDAGLDEGLVLDEAFLECVEDHLLELVDDDTGAPGSDGAEALLEEAADTCAQDLTAQDGEAAAAPSPDDEGADSGRPWFWSLLPWV